MDVNSTSDRNTKLQGHLIIRAVKDKSQDTFCHNIKMEFTFIVNRRVFSFLSLRRSLIFQITFESHRKLELQLKGQNDNFVCNLGLFSDEHSR